VGLTVRDVERSYRFYTEVVGMTFYDWESKSGAVKPDHGYTTAEQPDGSQITSAHSDAFDQLTNNPGAEFKTVMLHSWDGLILQLVEYTAGGGGGLDLDHARAGSMHLSFYVPDVEQKRREIEDRGDVRISSEIISIRPNLRSFYAEDPDGVQVEFLQKR
jgi:catechol 2,3-dioxygenase-like lactoylglutathione lyase family enzyme